MLRLFIFLSLVLGLLVEDSLGYQQEQIIKDKNIITILSIDGGGVRGIIPALILKNIELRLKKKKHITECFDIMAGTSTGGVIALLLNVVDHNSALRYTIDDVLTFYRKLAPEIFKRSPWHYFKTMGGLIGTKYDNSYLRDNMATYFKDALLDSTYSHVIIPAYDIKEDKMIFFKSTDAFNSSRKNYYLKDIAVATSSAPTYFSPHEFKNIWNNKPHTCIDGGVGVNNPTIAAIVYALDFYKETHDFFVLSLGCGTPYGFKNEKYVEETGVVEWASSILDVVLYASNEVTDYEVLHGIPPKHYYRLQVIIDPKYSSLDDASPENIKRLEKYAQDFIKENGVTLERIANFLDD